MTTSFQHKTSGRARAAFVGVLWAGLNSFVPAAVSGAVFLIASRFITPEDFGLVTLASGIALTATAFTATGFADVIVQRQDLEQRHLDSVFWLCSGSAGVVYALIVALAEPASWFFGEAALAPFLIVIGLRVLFDAAVAVPNALLIRRMSFARMAVRTTVASFLSSAVCLLVLYWGFGAWALALSQVTSSIAIFVGTMLALDWRPGWQFNWKSVQELARFGLSSAATRALGVITPEQFLIGALSDTTALGLYGFARRVSDILMSIITGALNAVSYTLLSSLQDEADKRREAFLTATLISSMVTIPIFVGLAAVAPDLVPFSVGHHWVEAVPILQLVCVGGVMASVGTLQGSLIRSAGKADLWFLYLAGKIAGSALVLLVMLRYGLVLALASTVAFQVVYWGLSVRLTCRLVQIGSLRYLWSFLLPLALSLIMGGTVVLVRGALQDLLLEIRLAAGVAVGLAVYLALCLVFLRPALTKLKVILLRTR